MKEIECCFYNKEKHKCNALIIVPDKDTCHKCRFKKDTNGYHYDRKMADEILHKKGLEAHTFVCEKTNKLCVGVKPCAID